MNARDRKEATALMILAASLALWIWSVAWRYDRVGDTTARTNRFTGTVQYLTLRGWQPRPDPILEALPAIAPPLPAPAADVWEVPRIPRINPFRDPFRSSRRNSFSRERW